MLWDATVTVPKKVIVSNFHPSFFFLFKHIYKLNRCGNSFKADRVCEVETDNRAVMNLDVHPDKEAIAVGTDHICQIFEMKKKIEKGQAKVALTSKVVKLSKIFLL